MDFVVKLYEFHDTSQLMASWWRKDNKFTNRSNGWYGTINLRSHKYICGSHLLAIWRKGLLQVFEIMDSFGIHNCNHWEHFELGRNNIQTTNHLCSLGSDTEGRRGTNFLHGLVPARCHMW
jgi:hypothetical protein